MSSQNDEGHIDAEPRIEIPKGAFLLLILFLIVMAGLWANVYLRVVWRA